MEDNFHVHPPNMEDTVYVCMCFVAYFKTRISESQFCAIQTISYAKHLYANINTLFVVQYQRQHMSAYMLSLTTFTNIAVSVKYFTKHFQYCSVAVIRTIKTLSRKIIFLACFQKCFTYKPSHMQNIYMRI